MCPRPIGLRARGTSHWQLAQRLRVPPGRYLLSVNAVDGYHHQQLRRSRPTAHFRVR